MTDETKFCSNCGEKIDVKAEICIKCGVRAMAPTTQIKNPGLAALASFIWCGAGQIYNGQILKGVVLLIAYVISFFLIIVAIGLFTTPLLWIYGMYDAYETAKKINAGEIVV